MKNKMVLLDKFQNRYLKHQLHKKEQLTPIYGEKKQQINILRMKKQYQEILKERRSQRLFNSIPVSDENIDFILNCAIEMPSSCNRQAISIKIIEDRNSKELLSGLLVGGVGWCHRADKILLLLAQKKAYKEKLNFMPFLDAGVQILNIYLACTVLGIGCCYINPNIRKENKTVFKKKFGKDIFCGALAIGNYDKKSKYSPKITKKDILL